MHTQNAALASLLVLLSLTLAVPAARAGFSRDKAVILTDTDTLNEAYADCDAFTIRSEVKMEGTHWSWTALVGDWNRDALRHDIRITLIRHKVTHNPANGETANAQLATQDYEEVCPLPRNTLSKGPFTHDFGPHPGTTEGHHDFIVVRFDDMQNGRFRMSVVLSHGSAAPALDEPLTSSRTIGRRDLRLGDAFTEYYVAGLGNRVTRTWRLVALDRDPAGNDLARFRQLPGFLERPDGLRWLEGSSFNEVEVAGTLTQIGTNSTARLTFGSYDTEATFHHPTLQGQRVVLNEAMSSGSWMIDLETARITGQRQVSSNRLDGTVIELSANIATAGQLSPGIHEQPDNGRGTIHLPPDPGVDGDGYISLHEFHLIRVTGMGTVDLVARHRGLRCLFNSVGIDTNCIVDMTPDDPSDGEEEEFESDLELKLLPKGALVEFLTPRVLVVPMRARIKTSPRSPDQPVQHFDAEVLDFSSGQLIEPDPVFASLRVVAGANHGLPSPGGTTLTRHGTNFLVHSYFDVNYQIEWVGAGPIAGFAGTNVGIVRMELGRVSPPIFTSDPEPVRRVPDLLGGTLEFVASADGEPPVTYQWFRNNEPLSGETKPILNLADVPDVMREDRFFVRAYNDGGFVQSQALSEVVSDALGFTSVRRTGDGGLEMGWRGEATLQSTDSLTNPIFTDVPGARSPHRVTAQDAAKYFRLRR